MSLDQDTVEKIAHLARLKLSLESSAAMSQQLERILGMIAEMQAVDTTGIEPMAHPLDLGQPLRADEVRNPNQREHLMACAPSQSAGLFRVPKVIE